MADHSSARSRSELNAWLVDEMHEQYLRDPDSLSPGWRAFFDDYRTERERRAVQDGAADEPVDGEMRSGGAPGAAPPRSPAGRERPAPEAARTVDGPDGAAGAATVEPQRLRGVQARIAENMERSLEVPTATSVRTIPAKLLEVNRTILNNYLRRTIGGKVSFTHLIAFAMVRAVTGVPAMKKIYAEKDGKPGVVEPEHVGLGLAIDMQRDDGSRALLVPCIGQADRLGFDEFVAEYEDIIRRVRTNRLDPSMFSGVTMTITNPGIIGTELSVPRLMPGQSVILGVGKLGYPAEWQAADRAVTAGLGMSKVMTLTSTYDHRVIQGAESGMWLQRIHELLLGRDGFYDDVFAALGVPYEPARWRRDTSPMEDERAARDKQMRVDALAHMYRVRGHLIADLDPLSARPRHTHPELDPTYHGLSIWDLDREFLSDGADRRATISLGGLLGMLRDAYCRSVGIEYMHIQYPEQKDWIREHVEGVDATSSPDEQLWILERLNAAEAFEQFLHTKYVGQKRFGLEGAESLIPLLQTLCEEAADSGMTDVVAGMSHRGRLNVLANVVGKSYREIFREFEGDIDPDTVQGSGDVKYHLGTSGTFESRSGNGIRVTLPPNPSHLEAVDPVVQGMVRALQDVAGDETRPALPVLLHGDAAFSGQGVVAEVFNQSQLRGYRTGGTVHVVINNQLGFTTAPESARSSVYPTDIAKMVQAPIFHVNGDDPEAVVRVARLAFAYRQEFGRDVVIDLVCYRRHGHNEADDPSFTQPLMYKKIDAHRSVRKLYTERLVKRGDISVDQAERYLDDFETRLHEAFEQTRKAAPPEPPRAIRPTEPSGVVRDPIETGVDRAVLERVAAAQFAVPDGFTRHPKLDRIFKRAQERYGNGDVDWALGETLALGSLLLEGVPVRLAGQDSRRGTFSQRHAVLVDFVTGEEYLPLEHLGEDQGAWFIYDSLLSEYAALGFEYGYSVVHKDALVAWEAQFGDFVNGAQVTIDQFVVAGEDKWDETSGLVLLLPHGYEGQGPEHSSARLERFLTLCAEDNIQVAYPTTSAQYFHLLRRQVHQPLRKPLVVFTPKSLLRSRSAVSHVSELTSGSFHETLDEMRWTGGARDAAGAPTGGAAEDAAGGAGGEGGPGAGDRGGAAGRDAVRALVLCTGKVAYDAMRERDERGAPLAIARVEQLYPWPGRQIAGIVSGYPALEEVVWLQEEPANMGAWSFVDSRLEGVLAADGRSLPLRPVSRVASASPAAGSHVVHNQEYEQLMDDLFAPAPR